MSISVSLIRLLIESAAARGVERSALLLDAEVPADLLKDPQGRLSLEGYNRLHDLALERCNDPALGLHMGETASVAALKVIGYLFMNCRTIEQAITVFTRYHHIISDCSDPVFRKEGRRATLTYDFPRGSAACNRARAEFGLTLIMRIGQDLLGRKLVPLQVCFEHARPEYETEYLRIFHQAPLRFSAPETAIVMPTEVLEEEHSHSDDSIYRVLEVQADRMLAALKERGFASQVQRLIAEQYHGIRPDMETIATRFHLSARSLRRRLKEENTTYSEVADRAVHQVACDRLRNPELSIQEIAYDLGFSEPSAFHRAFRRWSGMTPLQFRLRLGSAPGSP